MVPFFFLFSFSLFASRRALLIGIADYRALSSPSTKGMADLRGPVNDVMEIKKALVSYYGFSKNDIKILINTEATRKNIETSFNGWLVKETKERDTVVLYFSGHGSRVPDFNGDEKDGYDEVLLPYDMIPQGGYNIILDDEMGLWLNQLKGRNIIVIVDSCHSGGVVRSISGSPVSILENTPACQSRVIPITDYKPSPAARSIPKGADIPEPVIFMAASKENEIALEINLPGGYHGGFSFGLFEGMNNLKKPTYKELFDYARKVVKDRLKLFQEPQLSARKGIVDEFFLSNILPALNKIENRPVAPPEVIGEKVIVAVETIKGTSPEEMRILKEELSRLSLVKIVEKNAFFDRLIRGEKKDGKYYTRLLNRIGDVESIKTTSSMDELVKRLNQNLEYAYMVKQLAFIHHPNPAFKVKIWVTDDTRRDFRLGEKIVFGIQTERDSYIILINLDSKGNFHIIFPNKYHQKNFLKANTTVLIPDKAMSTEEFQLEFVPPAGEETVKVIATTKPLDLKKLGLGGFKETFQTLSGKTRAIFVKNVIKELSSNKFDWSEDVVVIRSHKSK